MKQVDEHTEALLSEIFVAADMLSAACESGISNPHLQYGRLQISRNRSFDMGKYTYESVLRRVLL